MEETYSKGGVKETYKTVYQRHLQKRLQKQTAAKEYLLKAPGTCVT